MDAYFHLEMEAEVAEAFTQSPRGTRDAWIVAF